MRKRIYMMLQALIADFFFVCLALLALVLGVGAKAAFSSTVRDAAAVVLCCYICMLFCLSVATKGTTSRALATSDELSDLLLCAARCCWISG